MVFTSSFLSFADVPNNDTVNISAYINAPINISLVILEDYAPYTEPYDIHLIAAANKTTYCIINTSDEDGYENINQTSLNVSIYLSGHQADSVNPKYKYELYFDENTNLNACKNTTMGGGASSDGYIEYNCSISIPYYAENGTWVCNATIYDTSTRLIHGQKEATAILHELIALNISTPDEDNSIYFGFLALGSNATNQNWNITVKNIGNMPIRVNMTATNMSDGTIDDTYGMNCNVSYINETDIYFDDSGASFTQDIGDAAWTNLERGWTSADDMMLDAAIDDSGSEYYIYWGLNLINSQNLSPQPKGACRGWLFFDAMLAE